MKKAIHTNLLIIFLFTVLLFSLITSVVNAQSPKTILKVGLYNFEPLVFIDETGTANGLYIDILEQIAQRENWELQYVPGTWEECVNLLETGEIDILPSIAYSEERAQVFDFTESLFIDWGVVYLPQGSNIQSILDLENKKVGMLKSDIYTQQFLDLIDAFDINIQKVEKDEYNEIFAAIASGELDAGINTQLSGHLLIQQYPQIGSSKIVFAPTPIRFAVPKGKHAEILSTLDQEFIELRNNPDSYYHKRLDFWMGQYTPNAKLPEWMMILIGSLWLLFILTFIFAFILRVQVRNQTAEIKQSEEKYRSLVENINDGVFSMSMEGNITYISPKVEQILGMKSDQVIGRHYTNFIYPEDLPRLQEELRDLIKGKYYPSSYRMVNKDGSICYVNSSSRLQYKGETVVGFTGIITDLTDKIELEELMHTNRNLIDIGILSAGIAHEIKSPLQIILMITQGLLRRLDKNVLDNEKLRKDLLTLEKNTNRVAHIIGTMLDYARSPEHSYETQDLNNIVSEALTLIKHQLEVSRNIRVNTQLSSDLPQITCDRQKIIQVIINLLSNARDVMPNGGDIYITTAFDNHTSMLLLTLSDTGPGIPDDLQDKIFESFFTTKPVGKGTGLGLSIVQGIVSEHGGTIKVENNQDTGVTFTILLPLKSQTEHY